MCKIKNPDKTTRLYRALILCFSLVTIAGFSCVRSDTNHKVNRENYNKIHAGMPREQVISILGEPNTKITSIPCKCADIETLGYLSGKIGIDVKIFNGKVCEKYFIDFKKYEIHD